jgi:hypothetical protein
MVSAPAARKIQNSAMASLGLHSSVSALFGHQVVGAAHEAEQQPHDQQVGVHHARLVERDVREHEVADQVLQAQRQAERDLPDEKASAAMKYSLATDWLSYLREVFSWMLLAVSLRCWAATFRCRSCPSTPGTGPGRRAAARQVELRHLPAARRVGRHGLHPALTKSPPRRLITLPSSGAKYAPSPSSVWQPMQLRVSHDLALAAITTRAGAVASALALLSNALGMRCSVIDDKHDEQQRRRTAVPP